MSKDVIFITIDCARYDRMSWNGYSKVRHKNMEKLFANAVVYDNCYAQSVATPPSHASFLTGEYPSVHGIRSMYNCGLRPEIKTIAERFKEKDYYTAAWVGFGGLCSEYGLDRGFDYVDENSDLSMVWGENSQHGAKGNDWRADASIHRFPVGKNVFAWFHYFFSHVGSDEMVPEKHHYLADDSVDPLYRLYDAKIKWFDEEWLPVLFDIFPIDDTIYIVTADHGECFDHTREVAHGRQMFKETLHIPMMISGLGDHRRVEEYTEARSILMSILYPENDYREQWLIAEIHRKIGKEDEFYRWTVFNQNWKFIFKAEKPSEVPQLEYVFNIADDPLEQRNLVIGDLTEIDKVVNDMFDTKGDSLYKYQIMPEGKSTSSDAHMDTLKALGYM